MPTVLVVDDEEPIRHIFRRRLEGSGYRVCEAGSADEALALLAREPISVALCDIRMPQKSGEWLAVKIASEHPAVAVIFVTAESALSAAIDTLPNVRRHLVKPVATAVLLEAVAEALAWHRTAMPSVLTLLSLTL